jgi:predicted trehalose synthase
METRKGRRWGAVIFGGEEGEEVRRLHGVIGGRHSEELLGGWMSKMTKGNWVDRLNARLGQTTDWLSEKI